MSDDNASERPEPSQGEQSLRLDADRTRDELQRTLDEVERRLTPSELLASFRRSARRHPVQWAGAGAGLVAVVAGTIALAVRASHRD